MRVLTFSERPDWRQRAEEQGFRFHTLDGIQYWVDDRAYAFSLDEIETAIEAPVQELEDLCLAFAQKAVGDEAILKRLAIPEAFWGAIGESWARGDRNLYGRFDFAYAGTGPAKLLEYNADTPTALFESAVFQWQWLEDRLKSGDLPAGSDQFNSLHERLVVAFKELRGGKSYPLTLSCIESAEEDLGTIQYLAECANQAGISTILLPIERIGLAGNGVFVDEDARPIDVMFKLYPWEWMLREDFGKAVPRSRTQFIEPLWKSVLSTKGLLPFLYEMAPGHPNLLPAYFADDPRAASLASDHVRKPLYSREGANVTLVAGGKVIDEGGGDYGAEGYIVQARAEIPNLGHGFVVLGGWVVASQAAGMCVREGDTPITNNTSRFVPHLIEA